MSPVEDPNTVHTPEGLAKEVLRLRAVTNEQQRAIERLVSKHYELEGRVQELAQKNMAMARQLHEHLY